SHNLRAALDQLICDLVVANRRTVSQTNGFLITGSKDTFDRYIGKKIDGISPKAERIIRWLKPYNRGDSEKFGSLLYMLDWLDDLDKHKGIIPVAASHVNLWYSFIVQPGMPSAPDADGNVTLRVDMPSIPFVCP